MTTFAQITGRKAEAIQAARVASDAIIRMIQPGKKNSEITPIIEKVSRRHVPRAAAVLCPA